MSKATLHWVKKVFLILLLTFSSQPLWADSANRFNYSGDGAIVLNGQIIRFRNSDGTYNDQGLKQIHQIFNANWTDPEERLALRFIELMDYLQDQLQGKSYQLKSGYRSPVYNQSLRNQGKLAAQSSMHTEGAAADLLLVGVSSSDVFDYVKSLNYCGIGWYHSQHFHLDSGPARYWSETTSKTEDKTPQQNEKIILQPDFDRYQPGETMDLKFMRVTEYPIGVSAKFDLVKASGETNEKPVSLEIQFPSGVSDDKDCKILTERKQSRTLKVKLPSKGIAPGQYAFKIKFCNRYDYEKMPEEILSKSFEVLLGK